MIFPQISLKNALSQQVLLYNAFQDNQQDKSLSNFFGTQTNIGPVNSGETHLFDPINGPASTYIIYDSENNPIKRVFTLGVNAVDFTVDHTDVDIMTNTNTFVKLLTGSPDNSDCIAFKKLIDGGKGNAKQVNDFFKNTTDYTNCTFISYMLAVVTIARTPKTKNRPPQEQEYKLSTLLNYMGVNWPNGFPDIVISDFFCGEENDILKLGGKLNINNVTFDDGVLANILSFLPNPEITFEVEVILSVGLAVGTTILKFGLDNIKIPIGGRKTFDIDNPMMILSITPTFKFVVFEVKATIPFNIFNSPTFNANLAMTIDNVEAEIGIEIDGNDNTLLTPPQMQGVHFDSFGVGIGLIFEPAGFAIGIDGKFHIEKESKIITLNDDQFVIVCEMEEEVPNPLFISFYVPELKQEDLFTIFTNTTVDLGIPITFSQLSFRWAESPMDAIVLPDGSLAPMGYGFSGFMDLFGLTFYGALEIDINNGVSGNLCMNELSLGNNFKLSGNSNGVNIKVDTNGNPIRNNAIPKTKADHEAIKNATTKQLIAPDGPRLTINTSKLPYFSLDAEASLFDIVKEKIAAEVSNKGISFELDYGIVLLTKMKCTLADFHNFAGSFTYGLDLNVSLPTLLGFHLGSIHLDAGCDVKLSIDASTREIVMKSGGEFDFKGIKRDFGPFDADINISKITDLIAAIENCIISNAEVLFSDIIKDAEKWASLVSGNVVKEVDDVANGLKTAYQKSAREVASIMNTAGYLPDTIASGIITAFASVDVLILTDALCFGANACSDTVSAVLFGAGYSEKETAQALKTVYNIAPDAINTLMKGAGYAKDAIKNAFEDLGGDFASAAKSIWQSITHWF